jgi:small multidrug resistance pump
MLHYLFLIVAILLGVAGQMALKGGAEGSSTALEQFTSPMTIIGFGIYVLSAFCYIFAIKKIPVSLAYPSVAASYALVVILAHFLWNEPVTWQHFAGIALIGSGILLLYQA